jgi:hypothetical protein
MDSSSIPGAPKHSPVGSSWENPSYLYYPGNRGDGKIEKLFINIPPTQMLIGVVADRMTNIATPTIDLFYSDTDVLKAVSIARQAKHQRRIPKGYFNVRDTHIDIAIDFRVKPIPSSLLKTLVAKKMQPLMQLQIQPYTELVTIPQAEFEREAFERSVFSFHQSAGFITVGIAKRYGERLVRLWEEKIAALEERPELFRPL